MVCVDAGFDGEWGCLPDRFRAPQAGMTSLHVAAGEGHVAVVVQLLAAGVNKEAKNMVRGGGG